MSSSSSVRALNRQLASRTSEKSQPGTSIRWDRGYRWYRQEPAAPQALPEV
jgi:hypothetical protein